MHGSSAAIGSRSSSPFWDGVNDYGVNDYGVNDYGVNGYGVSDGRDERCSR
jgi:hypothetical protein